MKTATFSHLAASAAAPAPAATSAAANAGSSADTVLASPRPALGLATGTAAGAARGACSASAAAAASVSASPAQPASGSPDHDGSARASSSASKAATPAAPAAPTSAAGAGAAATSAGADPSLASPKRPGISSFTLKIVAIIGMTANHTCYIYYQYLPTWAVCAFLWLGGLTFPIMSFLLVEGYHHTSNVKRYAQRLLVFALISQVPYGLFLNTNLNVMFTLLICLGVLYLNDHLQNRGAFWLATAALTALSALCDWGILGPLMVLLMQTTTGRRKRIIYPMLLPILGNGLPALVDFVAAGFDLTLLPFALYALVGCTLAIPLLLSYNGERGRSMKWFFYAYYPAHILVLGLLKGLLLGDWTMGY